MSKSANIFIILFLLTGCTPTIKPDSFAFPQPVGKVITEPVAIHTVWQNPLTYTTPTSGDGNQLVINGLEIDGLVDDAVEDRINAAIAAQVDVFLSWEDREDLPPMRGIYQHIDVNATIQQRYISAQLMYSINGVISVLVSVYFEFSNPQGDSVSVNVMEGLTFDCITGNELSLSDLLINGIDLAQRWNTATSDVLDSIQATEPDPNSGFFYESITLIQPFPGLRADQDFVLSPSGVQLILDHRTPEFDTHGFAQLLTVPYALLIPDLALTLRFDDPAVFSDPIVGWQLFQTQDTRTINNLIKISGTNREFGLPSAYPRAMNDTLLSIFLMHRQYMVEDWTWLAQSETTAFIEGGIYASPVGPYTCINGSIYAYRESEVLSDSWVNCYDESGKLLTLQALFQPMVDAQALIRQALTDEVISSGYYHPGFDMDEAMSRLQITLQLEGLGLFTFATAPGYTDPEYLYLFLSYTDLGVSRLSLLKPTH
jgi:hypothetical protein